MARRSIVATVSVFVHAIVLAVLATADLWRPISEWPTPRQAIAFEQLPVVRVADIQLPPQPRRGTVAKTNEYREPTADAAPVLPPPDLGPDGRQERLEPSLPFGVPGPIDNNLIGVPAGLGTEVLPPSVVVATQPPQAKTPIRHSGVKPPQRLVNVAPVYPSVALAVHKEGIVIIDATIDEQGNVTDTKILRSIPLLDEAAVAAVRQWKFSPTLLNGVPVPIVMTVTVNFKMNP
jgi:protein TonB